jgi:hypothetical protein
LITDVDLTIQFREQKGKAQWVSANSVCTADLQLPVILVNDITLGFFCQLASPIRQGAEVRVTATVLVDGRDKPFTVTKTKPT